MSDLNKIINLIKKTGDKCVVLDSQGNTYVIMGLKDYERLTIGRSEIRGLTEDELLDKINRDIALWKASQEEKKLDGWSSFSLNFNKEKIRTEELSSSLGLQDEDKYYFEPLE
jgi:hypothetical protein